MLHKYIYNETFQCNLHLIVGKNLIKKIRNIINEESFEIELVGSGQHFVVINGENENIQRFICLKSFKYTHRDISTLSHEIIHYITTVFNDKNIPISKENDETFAYFHECILSECLKYLFNNLKQYEERFNKFTSRRHINK